MGDIAKATVDGPNRLIIFKPGIVSVDVKVDLYSDCKELWLTGEEMKYPFPFRIVGGDPITGVKSFGTGYFITAGWKLRPHEADHELSIEGNIYLDEGEAGGIFVPTLGGFTVLATGERSADVIGVRGITDISTKVDELHAFRGLTLATPFVSDENIGTHVADGITITVVEAPAGVHTATRTG